MSAWAARGAPTIAGVLVVAVLVLGVLNFNVLITSAIDARIDEMTIVLPAVLFGAGLLGLLRGAQLRARRPDVFAGIGAGGARAEEETDAGHG